MVECTRCGCRNDNESRFCAACGFSLLAPRINRATPAAGFSPNPALWQPPAASIPLAQSQPMAAAPPEGEWDLVQRRAPYVPEPMGLAQPMVEHAAVPQYNPPAMPQPAVERAAVPRYNPPAMPQPAVEHAALPSPAYNPHATPARATTPPVGHTEPPRVVAAVLMGFLVSYEGNELGHFWPLYQGRLVVGRSQATEGLDIAIDHGATSARHAQLIAAAHPSRLSVQDLGSTNGTFVNDQRLAPGHAQMASHGDRIRFGGFTVRVLLVV